MENSGQQVEANESAEQLSEFAAVKARLEEIARAVDDEDLPLDDALDLYEEAVKLGLKASSLLEVGIVVEEEPPADEASEGSAEGSAAEGSAGGNPAESPVDDHEGASMAPGSSQADNGNAPSNSTINSQ